MSGRDVVLFGLMGADPTKIEALPIPNPRQWVQRWTKRGVLQTAASHAQVASRELALSCEKLIKVFPRFDLMFTGRTEVEVLSSLPHTYRGVARSTALPHSVIRSRAIRNLIRHNLVTRESLFECTLTAPPELHAFVKAYRYLHQQLPLGIKDDSAVCIHQHGVEAAWSLSGALHGRTKGPAVAYNGLREIHPIDALFLNWRMKLNLKAGQALDRAKLPQQEIEAAAQKLPLKVVASHAFRDRLTFYGLAPLYGRLESASAELTGRKTSWTLPESGDNSIASKEQQELSLRWVPEPF